MPHATRTLAGYLIDVLIDQDVRYVFGIPGVHNLELYRGLAGRPIRHVTARHEQGVGFMADGYARVSGRPGVCFTITGPGLTNIVTAMGQAYGDSVPLLVISSQNRRSAIGTGRGFLHELPDQRTLASGVAAASFVIDTPSQLPDALDQAFASFACARPRPVYIEIPRDVLASDATNLRLPMPKQRVPVPTAALLESAAKRLYAAARPVVLAGGGAVHANAELRRLVERLDAPLVMTVNGRGLLPPGHPLAVPMSPSLEPVRTLVSRADVVLAVGTEIGPTDYDMYSVADFPNPTNLIRIDIDADQLRRSAVPAVALWGDAEATLAALRQFDPGIAPSGPDGAAEAAATRDATLSMLPPATRHHVAMLDLIRDALPSAILVGDSTQWVYAGNLAFNAATPGSWFNSATGYGTLGYALPASTGAGLAAPDRPVVCLVGDGGLQFSLGELAVLREVGAWTAILLWNNGGYGAIRTSMTAAGIEPEGVDVEPPDFRGIARAYGNAYQLICDSVALKGALAHFGQNRQVLFLELRPDSFH